MDRVGADVAAIPDELYPDDDEVVDVFQIVTNHLFGQVVVSATNDEIPGGAHGDLVGGIARESELEMIPLDINLISVSFREFLLGDRYPRDAHLAILDHQTVVADVLVKGLGINAMEKRNDGRVFARPHVDVKKHASPNYGSDVGVPGSLGQVNQHDGSGSLALQAQARGGAGWGRGLCA